MDTASLLHDQNKAEYKKIFIMIYVEQLKQMLREIIRKDCRECRNDIRDPGKHKCQEFETIEKTFHHYGTSTTWELYMSDKHRWLVTRKFWSAVFDQDDRNDHWINDAKEIVAEMDMFGKARNE